MVNVPWAPTITVPARLASAMVVPLMVTETRSARPSASESTKVPLANSLSEAASEPSGLSPASCTSAWPPSATGGS
ncbi:hypothetical protein D9M68_385610 [compost metagenome]